MCVMMTENICVMMTAIIMTDSTCPYYAFVAFINDIDKFIEFTILINLLNLSMIS